MAERTPNLFLVRSGLALPDVDDRDPALDLKAPETLYATARQILELLGPNLDINAISLRSSPARRARESAAVLERPFANDRFDLINAGDDAAYGPRGAIAHNENVNGYTRLTGVINLEWLLERSVAAPKETAFVIVTHKPVIVPFAQLHSLGGADQIVPGGFVATRLNQDRI